jgi:hypothetical protein
LGNKVGQRDGEERPPFTASLPPSPVGKNLANTEQRTKEMAHRLRQAIFPFSTDNEQRQTGTGKSRERILCALMRSRTTTTSGTGQNGRAENDYGSNGHDSRINNIILKSSAPRRRLSAILQSYSVGEEATNKLTRNSSPIRDHTPNCRVQAASTTDQ